MGGSISSGQRPLEEANENVLQEIVEEEENSIDFEHKYNEFKEYINNETTNEQRTSNEEETREERIERKRKEMEDFYNEIINKREQRNKAINDITRKIKRMNKLEEELEKEKEEKQTLELHCNALKQVNKITKEMLKIRETQVLDLKNRLKDIEKKLLESPEEIKTEYEKQMLNYKKLRELYEQRAVAAEMEHKTMIEKELAKNALLEAKLKDIQDEIQVQLEKYQENKLKIAEMEKNINLKNEEIETLNENLTSSIAENHSLNSQMSLVNNLFSNIIINPCMNLDMLIKLIQDNYLLIIDLINNHEINDTVSLLVDIEKKIDQHRLELENEHSGKAVPSTSEESQSERMLEGSSEKIDEIQQCDEGKTEAQTQNEDKTHIQQEIANNLPKVWRILIELLNTHQEKYENTNLNESFESCYKNVQLQNGKTHQVISVSQTFIRLKHLILEKNHLNTQLMKLKTLNNHLEIRLNESEKRLNTVTNELKKTWSVVNKLKLQHKQLHTHEKILKYELKHKRNMINDLKIDLEYVREKWDMVKEKNEQNEMDYKILRKEFALRRLQYDGGRSSESGISTDTEDDNVEINETVDESDDDKSELVETQSEHDVMHTNSVMSIEEDEEGEIEEFDNEINESSLEVEHVIRNEINEQSETAQEDLQPIENTIEPRSTFEISENETGMSNTRSNNTLDSAVTNPDVLDFTVFNERLEEHIEENSDLPSTRQANEVAPNTSNTLKDENKNTQIIGQNIVKIKTITGQIKVITEQIPESSQVSLENNQTKGGESLDDEHLSATENSKTEHFNERTEPQKHDPSLQTKQLRRQSCIGNDNIEAETTSFNEGSESSSAEYEANMKTAQDKERENSEIETSAQDTFTKCENSTDNISETVISSDVRNLSLNVSSRTKSGTTNPSMSDVKGENKTENDNFSSNTSILEEVSRDSRAFSDIPSSSSSSNNIISETSPGDEKSRNLFKGYSLDSSTSFGSSNSSAVTLRTPEEILEARNARLKRLEDQTKSLFKKMSLTSQRSDTLSERLEELHDYYGASNERNSPTGRGERSSPNSERNSPSDETRSTNNERIPNTNEESSPSNEIRLEQNDETFMFSDQNNNE